MREIVPIVRDAAFAWIDRIHRHSERPVSWRFGCALVIDGEMRAVGCAGRPSSRIIEQCEPRTIEITRVATDGCENACSQIYGALCRAAAALGFNKAITYTLSTEPGTSLAASGFVRVAKVAAKHWDTKSRPRKETRAAVPRWRWERAL